MIKFYKLDENNNPVPCTTEESYLWNKNNEDRRVIELTKIGNIEISTVFIFTNLSLSDDGPPIVFETMVFGGKHDQWFERYATYDEAKKGHAETVEMVKNE